MGTYKGTPKKLSSILYDLDSTKIYELKEYKAIEYGSNGNFDMLKNYSQRYEILVPSDKEIRGIEYYEKKSIISKNGKEYTVYHVFTPSHELNTSEFAILMSGLIEECKQLGIETRSPEEIKRDEMLYAS